MILDCDFCSNVLKSPDKSSAVEAGWDWMTQDIKGGGRVKTVACPKCDASKVKETADKKIDSIKIIDKKSAEALNDQAQMRFK